VGEEGQVAGQAPAAPASADPTQIAPALPEPVPAAPPLSRPSRGYLLAALAAACWAIGGLTAKWLFTLGGSTVEPAPLSGARALIACAMVLVYLALFRRRELVVTPRQLPFLAAFGVFGLAMVHMTYFATIQLTNVPTAILLEYLAPIIVLVVSVLFLGERFTWALPAGVVLSIGGCALMVGAIGGEGLKVSPAGIAWGLASACFFALYTVLGKYATGRFSPWTLLAYGLGAAAIFWLVWLGPRPVLALLVQPRQLAAIVVMALLSTVIPFGAFLSALHHIDATKASITATLEPVIAGVVTYTAATWAPPLYAPLSALQLLGGGLVLAAVLVVQAPALLKRTGAPAVELPPAP
jgi:drug/metabolite transporter (DMT)-like permease